MDYSIDIKEHSMGYLVLIEINKSIIELVIPDTCEGIGQALLNHLDTRLSLEIEPKIRASIEALSKKDIYWVVDIERVMWSLFLRNNSRGL